MGHVLWVHIDDGSEATVKHALPLLLLDVLAVVGTCEGLGGPFLLEKGTADEVWDGALDIHEVEEVVFVPCHTDSLYRERKGFMLACDCYKRKAIVESREQFTMQVQSSANRMLNVVIWELLTPFRRL